MRGASKIQHAPQISEGVQGVQKTSGGVQSVWGRLFQGLKTTKTPDEESSKGVKSAQVVLKVLCGREARAHGGREEGDRYTRGVGPEKQCGQFFLKSCDFTMRPDPSGRSSSASARSRSRSSSSEIRREIPICGAPRGTSGSRTLRPFFGTNLHQRCVLAQRSACG